MNKTIDVILITYGEPTSNSFIGQWKYSTRILNRLTRRVAPIPIFAVPLIGAYRGWLRTRAWRRSNYFSSLQRITEKQGEALKAKLYQLSSKIEWRVHAAYEFSEPTFSETLHGIHCQNCDYIFMIPMYVASSDFTSGLALAEYERFKKRTKDRARPVGYVRLSDRQEKLAAIMGSFAEREMKQRGLDLNRCEKRGLLLGAHGTIISPLRNIKDTGYEETLTLYNLLSRHLSNHFEQISAAWLSHRRGGEWTSPTCEQAAKEMLDNGISDLVYFPFGFLADNEETELTSMTIFRKLGITSYTHLPCVNDDDGFIQFLAEIVFEQYISVSRRSSKQTSV